MSKSNDAIDHRNYGIDLLRIFSMVLVVLLHSLGRGGIINNTYVGTIQYKVAWLMEIMAYCAVDVFALISGYVCYTEDEKKINYANYIVLWLEVVFYGLLVTTVFNFLNITPISIKDYITMLFPVSKGLYWYFTAYTGLFIFIPFLNNAVRNTDCQTLRRIFMLIIIIFSMCDLITKQFYLNNGYSLIWLILLFLMGAIIKKCRIGEKIKNYKIFLFKMCFIIITYSYKIYGFNILTDNLKITNDLFISYTSPTILLIAILLLIYFSKIQFGDTAKKILKFSAPSVFAVYILNNHRLVWKYVIYNLFADLANDSVVKIISYPIAFSLAFVVIVILVDKIRQLIFSFLNIKGLITKILNYYNLQ